MPLSFCLVVVMQYHNAPMPILIFDVLTRHMRTSVFRIVRQAIGALQFVILVRTFLEATCFWAEFATLPLHECHAADAPTGA